MEYKAIPGNLFEWFGLRIGYIPEIFVDMVVPAVKVRAIECSVNLGILKEIAGSKKNIEEISDNLSLNKDALNYLLRILITIGFLKKRGKYYYLTGIAKKIIGINYKYKSENFIKISHIQRHLLDDLEKVIKTGNCIGIYKDKNKKNYREDELITRGFLDINRRSAYLIKNFIPVKKGAKKILDIGGAHGFVSSLICNDHTGMKSTVIDSEGVIKAGKKIAVEEGYDNNIDFIRGNILNAKIGNDWDVIFAGNVLHVFTLEEIKKLLKKMFDSLVTDGTIAIFDIAPAVKRNADILTDSYSLLFYLTSHSKCYSKQEYKKFLMESGFKDIKIFSFSIAILVTARKKS